MTEQRKLFQRSGDMCAFPGCKKALTAQRTDTEPMATLGEIAHIVADSPNGPRGLSSLTAGDRNKYENLIVLCNYHHQLIDSQPGTWTVQRLVTMKHAHEAWVRRQLGSIDPVTGVADPRALAGADYIEWFITEAERWPVVDSSIDRALLGIHAALPLPSMPNPSLSPELPEYVRRDIDSELRAAVGGAKRRSAFILLVGPSASGKTRTAFEAVRTQLPDWRMIIPPTVSDLNELVLSGIPLDRSVIWLDELADYLAPGTLSAWIVRRLLADQSGPLLVIGSMWPADFERLSERSDRGLAGSDDASAVLRLAARFDIGPEFTDAELDRATETAAQDPRIGEAIEHSTGTAVTSSLACAPELIHRWQQPSDPLGAAVTTAAVEARLCGHPAVIPPSLLERLAADYLTGAQRATARPDWFDAALQWAQHPVRGEIALLTPSARRVGQLDGYQVSDVLIYHSMRRHALQGQAPRIPWNTLVEHADVDACRVIAVYALSCGYSDHAATAWERLAETGDVDAMIGRGMIYQDAADNENAAFWYRRAVEAGDSQATGILATALQRLGREEEARDWIRRGAEAGVPAVMVGFGQLHERAGDYETARYWYEAATAAGDTGMGRLFLGCMVRDQGDMDTAIELLREAADAARAHAGDDPSRIPMPVGATATAIGRFHESVTRTYVSAAFSLAEIYRSQERFEEAKTWFSRTAELGDIDGMAAVGGLIWDEGDHELAMRWLRPAAEAGEPEAMLFTALGLDESGHSAEAGEWFRRAASEGHPFAMGRYAIYLREQGEDEQARAWASKASAAGDSLISACFEVLDADESESVVVVTEIDSDDLSDSISWTPLAHSCGCTLNWGWSPAYADPPSFLHWCCTVVSADCPRHAAGRTREDEIPLLVRVSPDGPAFYAQVATGAAAELGRRIASALRELLAMAETSEEQSATISPEGRARFESGGHDVVDECFMPRLANLIFNHQVQGIDGWATE